MGWLPVRKPGLRQVLPAQPDNLHRVARLNFHLRADKEQVIGVDLVAFMMGRGDVTLSGSLRESIF